MVEKTRNTEFVVIGSGASGTVAALTAAEGGARVILLEKMRSLGGASNFTEGIRGQLRPHRRKECAEVPGQRQF